MLTYSKLLTSLHSVDRHFLDGRVPRHLRDNYTNHIADDICHDVAVNFSDHHAVLHAHYVCHVVVHDNEDFISNQFGDNVAVDNALELPNVITDKLADHFAYDLGLHDALHNGDVVSHHDNHDHQPNDIEHNHGHNVAHHHCYQHVHHWIPQMF